MQAEIDYDAILSDYRSDPYDYVDVYSPHTGKVNFAVEKNAAVDGPSGKWHHIPGSLLYKITRERNPKEIHSHTNGVVSFIRSELEGDFVEAGEKLLTIKHPLRKREIIEGILQKVLYLFRAPEKAKYFFALDIQTRLEKHGDRGVSIETGEEIITMSLMKRDTPVYYDGAPGIIQSIYLRPGATVEQGEPLIGVCAPEQLPLIQQIITHVKAEWE
jgi:hypothetical protein